MQGELMIDKSCRDFLELLAGKSAVPGGGGAAALGSALGLALTNMVSSLTVGKKKYAQYEEEIQEMLKAGLILQRDILELVEADAAAFAPLAKAYGLPANTPQEQAAKKEAIAEASKDATSVPLLIAEKTYNAMLLARRIAEIGSRLAISDAGCSILFLQAALGAARYNILINLPMLTDHDFALRVQERLQFFLHDGERLVKETIALVDERL
ncbi:MAG: cyclodeaminase/cyclohydrolase family protein [Clostridiales bacterium]